MISGERTIIFCLGTTVIQRRYRKWAWSIACTCALCNNLVKFPPPLIAVCLPLHAYIPVDIPRWVGGGSGAEEAHAPLPPPSPQPALTFP